MRQKTLGVYMHPKLVFIIPGCLIQPLREPHKVLYGKAFIGNLLLVERGSWKCKTSYYNKKLICSQTANLE